MAEKAAKSAHQAIPEFVGTKAMAAILGVTTQRVRQLGEEGAFQAASRDRWPLIATVQGFIAYRSQPHSNPAADRLAKLKSDALETRLLREQGTLVEHAKAEGLAVVDAMLGPLKSDLYALPARITSDLVLRRKIESGINDVLRAAAKRAGETAEGA